MSERLKRAGYGAMIVGYLLLRIAPGIILAGMFLYLSMKAK